MEAHVRVGFEDRRHFRSGKMDMEEEGRKKSVNQKRTLPVLVRLPVKLSS